MYIDFKDCFSGDIKKKKALKKKKKKNALKMPS